MSHCDSTVISAHSATASEQPHSWRLNRSANVRESCSLRTGVAGESSSPTIIRSRSGPISASLSAKLPPGFQRFSLPAAHHDFAQAMFAGIAQNRTVLRAARKAWQFQPPTPAPAAANRKIARRWPLRQPVQTRCFDIHRVPDAAEARRQPRRDAHQFFVAAAMPDAQQQLHRGCARRG
jgi:hypothetical protein